MLIIPVIQSTTPGLKLVHINCRSLFKNFDQLVESFKNCDIVCCTETWLRPELLNSLIFFPGKKIFRLDRNPRNNKSRGGGVCIYVSDKLAPFTEINDRSTCTNRNFEILTVNISKPNTRYLHVSCIYKPPIGKIDETVDFLRNMYNDIRREIWSLGDFNVDFLDRTNENRLKFLNVFKAAGIRQLITNVTRPSLRGGTCIDWIITNSDFVRATGVLDIVISDHLPVYCIRKKAREHNEYVYRIVRDYSNYNANVFGELIRSLDWGTYTNMRDCTEMWNFLYKSIYDILAVMCPFKRYKQRKKLTPWMTPDIYRAMRQRDSCISLFRVTGNSDYLKMARDGRNRVNQMVMRAKSNFIKSKLRENSTNPKKFWRVINNIINPDKCIQIEMRLFDKVAGNLVDHDDEADFLNDFFLNIVQNLNIRPTDNQCIGVYDINNHFCFMDDMPTVPEILKLIKEIDVHKSSCVEGISARFCKDAMLNMPEQICKICCISFETGLIPASWTRGTINVIPKDGDLSDPANWRPITQTSIFAKLLEKLVHVRLLKYFLQNNVISEYQFGYLPGRSTQLAVFELLKQIFSSMNNKKIFGSICLDISKAFDCIDHTRLFNKLMSCGISELVLKWFKSYFSRTQVVKVGNVVSQCKPVRSGIGQGTILGPLIFVFYINDVMRHVGNLRVNMYADDCLIYTVGNNWENMVPYIQDGLDDFQHWCENNCLKLNTRKSKSLVIGTQYKLAGINVDNRFKLENLYLGHVGEYNYLGIIFDSHMTLSPVFSRVKKRVSGKIYMLAKIRKNFDVHCAVTIYKQTILPLLDYAGFLLISGNKSDRSDLQTLQNDALRICFNVKLRDRISIARMHCNAKLLSLEQRRQKQLLNLMFIFKQRHDNVRRLHGRNTRAANVYSFTRERYHNNKYKNSPFYKGALLWDTLPVNVKRCDTVSDFKKSLNRIYVTYSNEMV